jgi:hypothetical protein
MLIKCLNTGFFRYNIVKFGILIYNRIYESNHITNFSLHLIQPYENPFKSLNGFVNSWYFYPQFV